MPSIVAEKLISLIVFMENAETLNDVNEMMIYHLHLLKGDRIGQFALDVAGRKSGYRLIIVPIKNNGEEWKEVDLSKLYCSTEVVIAREVSNHYE